MDKSIIVVIIIIAILVWWFLIKQKNSNEKLELAVKKAEESKKLADDSLALFKELSLKAEQTKTEQDIRNANQAKIKADEMLLQAKQDESMKLQIELLVNGLKFINEKLELAVKKAEESKKLADNSLALSKELSLKAEQTKAEQDIRNAEEAKRILDELIEKSKRDEELKAQIEAIIANTNALNEQNRIKIGDVVSCKSSVLMSFINQYGDDVDKTFIPNTYYDVIRVGTVVFSYGSELYDIIYFSQITVKTGFKRIFHSNEPQSYTCSNKDITKIYNNDYFKVGDRVTTTTINNGDYNDTAINCNFIRGNIITISGIITRIDFVYSINIDFDKIENGSCVINKIQNPVTAQDIKNNLLFKKDTAPLILSTEYFSACLTKQTVVSRVLGKFMKFF